MQDFAKLKTGDKAEKGSAMEVLHPVTLQPMGAKIFLAGFDSQRYRTAQNKMLNARMALKGGRRITAEEVDAQHINLLAAVTISWEGLEWNGEKLECTPENAKMLYSELPWLRDQASEFITDRANFLQD